MLLRYTASSFVDLKTFMALSIEHYNSQQLQNYKHYRITAVCEASKAWFSQAVSHEFSTEIVRSFYTSCEFF